MKITFKLLKDFLDKFENDDHDFFIKYINKFKGNNVLEKMIEILKHWERDVSYDMGLLLDNKEFKVTISYLISEMEKMVCDDISVEIENIKILLNIPTNFINNIKQNEIQYFIKNINYLNININFDQISEIERNEILDILPAGYYNIIHQKIIDNEDNLLKLSNPKLEKFKIDFYGNDPIIFLKSLFQPYSKDYYRDVIYHLSKKIDGDILMESTIMDIDYYIEKASQDQNNEELPSLA